MTPAAMRCAALRSRWCGPASIASTWTGRDVHVVLGQQPRRGAAPLSAGRGVGVRRGGIARARMQCGPRTECPLMWAMREFPVAFSVWERHRLLVEPLAGEAAQLRVQAGELRGPRRVARARWRKSRCCARSANRPPPRRARDTGGCASTAAWPALSQGRGDLPWSPRSAPPGGAQATRLRLGRPRRGIARRPATRRIGEPSVHPAPDTPGPRAKELTP